MNTVKMNYEYLTGLKNELTSVNYYNILINLITTFSVKCCKHNMIAVNIIYVKYLNSTSLQYTYRKFQSQ